jgi:hypothetical protein
VATLVAGNVNEAMVGSGGVCVWRESGDRRSVLCWCVWQESGFSRREDFFTFNLFERYFINCVLSVRFVKTIVQSTVLLFNTKEGSFSFTLTGGYYTSNLKISLSTKTK